MIELLATGAMTTVQDLGRHGYRQFGVGVSGALDTLAAAVGNAMLGNDAASAFVEIMLFPFRVRFGADSRIALTGADARAALDGDPVWPWWCLPVRAGQVLSLQAPESGGVAYLCIEGGIDVPPVLGSRSTDLKAGFGGFEGRTLRKGDRLQHTAIARTHPSTHTLKKFGAVPPITALQIDGIAEQEATQVRVLPAAEWGSFSSAARGIFLSTHWKVSANSNRIGARLEGPAINPERELELLSHGIVPGVIQIPPSGQPIVMQCDAQTSGGYPKIATVIEADQWRVAQTPLGGRLCFRAVSLEEAHDALTAQHAYLRNVRRAAELVG
jgi:biotin-dependent carboxylase-like uncharacterized protein